MKYFMTDVHGDYEGMETLLAQAELEPGRDRLVFGGDFINRGKDSAKAVRRI